MNNIIKKYIGKSSLMMAFALMATGTAMTSCSDDTLSNINTDKTKVNELDPNAQLLLPQTGAASMPYPPDSSFR